MSFHSDKTASFVVPVQPDQPPSGTAAWLREMARGSNSVNGGLVAERQARIDGDAYLQSEIDALTGGTGVVGPPGPPGPTGPAGAPGLMGPAGPTGATGAASTVPGPTGATGPSRIVALADTPPASPAAGDEWYDSVGGQLYIRFNDGTSSQWVPTSNQPGPPGAAGAIGPAGATGATGAAGAASTVPGPAGATGAIGATGATGPAGSANMSGMVAGQFPVAASATTVTSSAMTWDAANQRLGIGTTGPNGKLHVSGADVAGIAIVSGVTKGVRIGANSTGGIIDGVDNTGAASYQPLAVNGSYVTILNGGTEYVRATGGNVGIGTAGPATKLHVVGPATAGGIAQTIDVGPATTDSTSYLMSYRTTAAGFLGGIVRNGTTSVQYATSSDERLKEHISDTSLGLEEVMQLKVRDYNFKNDDRQEHGLIAQEVAKVYPLAVHTGGKDPQTEPWMIDYGRLTPLLIRAVQQLQAEIERLKRGRRDA